MRKRKHQVTEENLTLTVFGSNKRCSNSGGEYFVLIPVDLVIKILSKLSAKSMAKCRCVCKLWSSTIRLPNYNQLFFYTSPQPENPDENSSLVATAHHHTEFPRDRYQILISVHGLVCYKIKNDTVFVIYNPITGQYVTLPKVTREAHETINYFAIGYDPINKQFKVLCITSVHHGTGAGLDTHQHQVLTFETGRRNLFWRKIQCCRHYYAHRYLKGICINGVLYYAAATSMQPAIVCFDVRSEKFDFITWKPPTLINYKGKLGAIKNTDHDLVLWVLEDGEKHKWSKHIFVKPLQLPEWNAMNVDFGVTGKGEVVFCPIYDPQVPFYIFYYNLEGNTVVRVRVEVPESQGLKRRLFRAFPNYIEDMKLM
ncbi:unnamed protein product [Arabidopsis halleri]